jgi:hypothetical protein
LTVAVAIPPKLAGVLTPRIAPPVPAISLLDDWKAAAAELGIEPMGWQTLMARYLNARDGDRWLYPEIAILAARQNGKTEILKPLILQRLRMGRRILHTAQNREIPRGTFLELAGDLAGDDFVKTIRQANGQETITVHALACNRRKNCNCKGGKYTLVAPRPGLRGHGVDDVIMDEVREQRDFSLIAAIKPTVTAARDRQVIYLSNAGDDTSVVLNDLKRRGESGAPRFAYIEYSAAPERRADDRQGWAEANPGLGSIIDLDTLEDEFNSLPPEVFETEHLTRWVTSMQPKLVSDIAWKLCQGDVSLPEGRPAMAFSMDPNSTRASAALSWQMADGRIALRELADVPGSPIDTDALGKDLKALALEHRVRKIGYSSWTDEALARHMPKAESIDSKEFASATGNFVQLIQAGKLVWDACDDVTGDLVWTGRKPHEASGSFTAIPSTPERPITAALAAIRATWLASAPKPAPPRIG